MTEFEKVQYVLKHARSHIEANVCRHNVYDLRQ